MFCAFLIRLVTICFMVFIASVIYTLVLRCRNAVDFFILYFVFNYHRFQKNFMKQKGKEKHTCKVCLHKGIRLFFPLIWEGLIQAMLNREIWRIKEGTSNSSFLEFT
jgi:hypothetical protein